MGKRKVSRRALVGGIGAASFTLRFDPARLQPIACSPDPDQAFDLALCRRSGKPLRLDLISAGGTAARPTLAAITFRTLGVDPDGSSLMLEQRVLADTEGNDISD